ncbi:iron uptake system protein EfeO [Cohnella sp. AR92]|uniref:iron uptake system protein EfeO n=1 Tax=Cohnella sp. AR92 TaxID=648716 RepID=UPI0018642962|nr:iron uptake system protein EfeO [Cohnella sp. AR92]
MSVKWTVPALLLAASLTATGCSSNNENNKEASPSDSAATAQASASASSIDWAPIVDSYRQFSIEQADTFITETEKFVSAVKSGDIKTAKQLYAPTRMYYERIEPIAEALGDLDPNIDARENDVEEKDWRGFHRLEKALWVDNSTANAGEYADRLLEDAKTLRALMETVDIEPTLLVTGAVELLNEVSSSKVTGEEERYSRTDLYDFAANIEGARKIYELLQPELNKKDPELEAGIGKSFADLEEALADYKVGDGYAPYTDLKEEDTKKLSRLIDALAEPLSQMGVILGA